MSAASQAAAPALLDRLPTEGRRPGQENCRPRERGKAAVPFPRLAPRIQGSPSSASAPGPARPSSATRLRPPRLALGSANSVPEEQQQTPSPKWHDGERVMGRGHCSCRFEPRGPCYPFPPSPAALDQHWAPEAPEELPKPGPSP